MFIMLFNIEQGVLAEETLGNLWQFAKSATVSTLQSFRLYGMWKWNKGCKKIGELIYSLHPNNFWLHIESDLGC